jgi:lipid-A-disaccharide synthase
MIERLQARKTGDERDPNLIGLFPGSRSREVRKIFPVMLETAHKLHNQNPNLRFEVAAASEQLAGEMKPAIAGLRQREQTFQIKVHETAAIMQRTWVGMVASGSATLEAAYFRLPFVLIYKVAWPTYLAARLVVNVKYLGMPNLLAEQEVIPEFIQHRAKPNAILKALQSLIENTEVRKRMISQLDAIIPRLGDIGASKKAAQAIIEELGSS